MDLECSAMGPITSHTLDTQRYTQGGVYPFFLGNLWWILREFQLKNGLKLCIFSLPNTKFSYARGRCPLATPARGPAVWTSANGLLASFVPHKNLPKPMIQIENFVVHYDNIYDKIHTFLILFFWWFILNVLGLIFKNFWSKSIDSGKKELILNSRFGHNLKQIYILPKCIYSFNKYFFLIACSIFARFCSFRNTFF